MGNVFSSLPLQPLEEHVRARWFMQARRFILWSVGIGEAASAPKALLSLQRRQVAAAKAGKEYVLTTEEKLLLKIQPSKPIWIDVASATLHIPLMLSSFLATGELRRRLRGALDSAG